MDSADAGRGEPGLTPAQIVLRQRRAEIAAELSLLDKAEKFMADLPEKYADRASVITCNDRPELLFYHLGREGALDVMRALSAGRWDRTLNPSYPDKLDYTTRIDGVKVQIYGVQPPHSCRIVEEEVHVPAHTVTKRTVVCK